MSTVHNAMLTADFEAYRRACLSDFYLICNTHFFCTVCADSFGLRPRRREGVSVCYIGRVSSGADSVRAQRKGAWGTRGAPRSRRADQTPRGARTQTNCKCYDSGWPVPRKGIFNRVALIQDRALGPQLDNTEFTQLLRMLRSSVVVAQQPSTQNRC
jgi:hypothetical protein